MSAAIGEANTLHAMDLPDQNGTYILIAVLLEMKRLKVGRLGTYDIVPGFYAYVGSAFGPGGLRARMQHHLESVAEPHWHLDYLLGYAEPVEVWYAFSDRKLEQDLAEQGLSLRVLGAGMLRIFCERTTEEASQITKSGLQALR